MDQDDRPLDKVEVLVAGRPDGLDGRLADLGCVVLPVAVSAADALELLSTLRPDAALLDARLPGGPAVVARSLAATGMPFALVVAPADPEPDDAALRDVPRLG